jgi:hypothetical protein
MLPTPVHVHPTYASCGQSPYAATFHTDPTELDRFFAPEKKCSRLHLLARLSGPQDPPQFLSQHIHWSNALKPNIYRHQATRLTGPISPTCDQYVQYLLTGTNPSVLNWHRRELPHRKLQNSHNTLPAPSLPRVPLIPLMAPPGVRLSATITNWTREGTSPKSHEWEPPLDFYCNLPSKHSITNSKPPQDGGNKDKLEGRS